MTMTMTMAGGGALLPSLPGGLALQLAMTVRNAPEAVRDSLAPWAG